MDTAFPSTYPIGTGTCIAPQPQQRDQSHLVTAHRQVSILKAAICSLMCLTGCLVDFGPSIRSPRC